MLYNFLTKRKNKQSVDYVTFVERLMHLWPKTESV